MYNAPEKLSGRSHAPCGPWQWLSLCIDFVAPSGASPHLPFIGGILSLAALIAVLVTCSREIQFVVPALQWHGVQVGGEDPPRLF